MDFGDGKVKRLGLKKLVKDLGYMMNGGNVFDLQKLLGHTKIDMTMRYAHFSPNHLQGSLRFMNMYEGESSVAQEFIPVLDLEEKKVLDNLRIITG